MKKGITLTVFSVLIIAASYVLYCFNHIPHKKYTNADFNRDCLLYTSDRVEKMLGRMKASKLYRCVDWDPEGDVYKRQPFRVPFFYLFIIFQPEFF